MADVRADREYLDSVRRAMLGIVAAYLKLHPDSRLTLAVRIVEREDAPAKIA